LVSYEAQPTFGPSGKENVFVAEPRRSEKAFRFGRLPETLVGLLFEQGPDGWRGIRPFHW
jgi:hypothetical protein